MKTDRHSRNGFLCSTGLKEAAQRERQLYGVDNMEMFPYLDSSVSVSGLRRDEAHWVDDEVIDQQYRRFQHGW